MREAISCNADLSCLSYRIVAAFDDADDWIAFTEIVQIPRRSKTWYTQKRERVIDPAE